MKKKQSTVTPNSTERPASKTVKKHNRRKFLWIIAVIPAILIILAASVYGYYIFRYNDKVAIDQSYVNSWNDLTGQTTIAGTTPGETVSPGVVPAIVVCPVRSFQLLT